MPDDFAAALGHAVAGFGFLEEALKRTLYSISARQLGENAAEHVVQAWLVRMQAVADDSMGTLIDQFRIAIRDINLANGSDLIAALNHIKQQRNLLCHASWYPADGHAWTPCFINTKGEAFAKDLTLDDLITIRTETLKIAAEIVGIMRRTGIEGELLGQSEKRPITDDP